jgi:alpha-tubulin suppressor-like RCC1 family protein
MGWSSALARGAVAAASLASLAACGAILGLEPATIGGGDGGDDATAHDGALSTDVGPDAAGDGSGPADAGDGGEGGPARVSVVATGDGHTCVLDTNGLLWCWGDNRKGQLTGAGPNTSKPGAVTALPRGGVVSVHAGRLFTCAVLGDGGAACWGEGTDGQLGDGKTMGDINPTPVAVKLDATGGRTIRTLSLNQALTGANYACAILSDGAVWCWGAATTTAPCGFASGATPSPTPITGATAISAGFKDLCAVLGDGGVSCCGSNLPRTFDGGADPGPTVPYAVPLPGPARAVSVGESQACVILTTNEVYCWGGAQANKWGQIGLGNVGSGGEPVPTPTRVPGFGPAKKIACAWRDCCALVDDALNVFGKVRCSGVNDDMQLQDVNTTLVQTTPNADTLPQFPQGFQARDLSIDWRHDCATDDAANLWCWGANISGEMGIGTAGNTSAIPIKVVFPAP